MKGYKDLPNINRSFPADYIKRIKREAKNFRRDFNARQKIDNEPWHFDNLVSKKFLRLLEKGGFEVMNLIALELRHQLEYHNSNIITRPLFESCDKEEMLEIGLNPMFLSNMAASLYLPRIREEEILEHRGQSEQTWQLLNNLLGCFSHDSDLVKNNWHNRNSASYEDLEFVKHPDWFTSLFDIENLHPHYLFEEYTTHLTWFIADKDDDSSQASRRKRVLDALQQRFSLLNLFDLYHLKDSGKMREMSHPDFNDGKPMKYPIHDAYNDFLTETYVATAEFMNMNYFYNSPNSDRIVIYPDSAELLEDILDAEYHVDGIDFSDGIQSFALMIPEGFTEKSNDYVDEAYEMTSMYVSIASGYEINAQSARSAASFLRSQGLESLAWAWDEKAKIIELGGDPRFLGDAWMKKPEDGPAYVFQQQKTPMYSSDMTDEELDALAEHYERDMANYRSKCLVVNCEGQYWILPLCMAQVILLAEAGDKKARRFAEKHFEFLMEEGLKIVRLVASVLIYIKALGDEVLHRGVPNKKENRAGLLEKTAPTKSNNPKTFTLKGPRGYTGRKQGSHYRRWHFRTLKHERYYQTGEWAGKPIGSRVVFVRDSFVNKDVCPHVLTDGTNVEEKVISPESLVERD